MINIITTIDGKECSTNIESKLFKDSRTIYFNDEVNSRTASELIMALRYLDSFSSEDITLYINSPGGSVSDGLAIYDCINDLESDVVTVAHGLAASMGAFLLACGTKGKRYAAPNAEIMIHQPLGGMQGQASDIAIHAEHITKIKKKLNTILAERTGQDVTVIERCTDRDNFLSAAEAKAFGVVDHVRFPDKY